MANEDRSSKFFRQQIAKEILCVSVMKFPSLNYIAALACE